MMTPSRDSLYQAFTTIPGCSDTGQLALNRSWDEPPADTVALRLLGNITGQIRDQRLFEKVRSQALNPAVDRNARLTAMAVLVSYFDPHLVVDYPSIDNVSLPTREYVQLGSRPDPVVRDGPQPLSSSTSPQLVLNTLLMLRGDSDSRISSVASFITDWLKRGSQSD